MASSDELRAERITSPSSLEQMTVAELLERWLRLGEADWTPKTAHDHRNTVRAWISPLLGDRLVVDLCRSTIEEFKPSSPAPAAATAGRSPPGPCARRTPCCTPRSRRRSAST